MTFWQRKTLIEGDKQKIVWEQNCSSTLRSYIGLVMWKRLPKELTDHLLNDRPIRVTIERIDHCIACGRDSEERKEKNKTNHQE